MPIFFPERDRMVWQTKTTDHAFKYAQVEQAIAALHNVPPSGMQTFKSRLKHFQRIGLVPSRPGKGKKINYNLVDAIMWALCFEFAELGVPPEQIKFIISAFVHQLISPFDSLLESEDQIFVMQGNFLEWHLNPSQLSQGEGSTTGGTVPASKLGEIIFEKEKFPRVLLINLTNLKRRLGAALNIDWR